MGDIPDAESGHSWLTAKGLLAPSGSMPSLAALAETLFQVGALPNTPLQTLNGIQAVAFLLQELEIAKAAKEVSSLVSKELNVITDRIQTTLSKRTEENINRLHEKAEEILAKAKDSVEELGKLSAKMGDIAKKERTTPFTY